MKQPEQEPGRNHPPTPMRSLLVFAGLLSATSCIAQPSEAHAHMLVVSMNRAGQPALEWMQVLRPGLFAGGTVSYGAQTSRTCDGGAATTRSEPRMRGGHAQGELGDKLLSLELKVLDFASTPETDLKNPGCAVLAASPQLEQKESFVFDLAQPRHIEERRVGQYEVSVQVRRIGIQRASVHSGPEKKQPAEAGW